MPSPSTVPESESHVTDTVSGSLYFVTVAVSGVSGAGTLVHTLAHRGSEAHGVLSGSTLSNEPKPLGLHRPPPPRSILSLGEAYKSWVSCSWSSASSVTLVLTSSKVVGCGGYKDGGSGGDGNAAGAMHLAKRSPAEGGDSEVSGDGDGVGMARSLSTSASGGRDMEVCGRIVILAPVVVVSVKGGGMMGYVPLGGETSSSVVRITAESVEAKCSSSSSSSFALYPDESPSSSSPSSPPSMDNQPDHPLSHHPHIPLDPLLDLTQQHTLETQHGIHSGYIGSGTKSGSCGCMNIGSCSSSSCCAGGICGSSRPGERLARCMAPAALPSPPLPPSLYPPQPIDRKDDIPESEQPPRKRLCLSTLGSKYEVGESSTRGRGVDY
nr:hypothetical protein [Tanacetum cinerariifolium]